MNVEEFLEIMDSGKEIVAGSAEHKFMHILSQEARQITMEINSNYHTEDEIRDLMQKLTARVIDESFVLFPPFYTDCGKNIKIGRNVFINSACMFKDQGGIEIGDGDVIAAGAAVNKDVEKRTVVGGVPAKFIKNVDK